MNQVMSNRDEFEGNLLWALRCLTLWLCLAITKTIALPVEAMRKLMLRASKPADSHQWHFLDGHFDLSTVMGRTKAATMDFAHQALCKIWGFDDEVAYGRLLTYPLNTPFMGYSRSVQDGTFVRTWRHKGEDYSRGPEWVDRLVPCGIMQILKREVVDNHVHIHLQWMSGPKRGTTCVVEGHISFFREQHVVPDGGTWPSRNCPAHVAFIPKPLVYMFGIVTVGLLTAAWPWIAKAARVAWPWVAKATMSFFG